MPSVALWGWGKFPGGSSLKEKSGQAKGRREANPSRGNCVGPRPEARVSVAPGEHCTSSLWLECEMWGGRGIRGKMKEPAGAKSQEALLDEVWSPASS